MGSVALETWRTVGLARLGELEGVHAHITGSPSGRRWGMRQLTQSLFVVLMAQFRAFCRDLHDEAIDVHVTHAVPGQRDLLLEVLTRGRKLQVGNPRRSVLGADFGRLDVRLMEDLKKLGSPTLGRLDRLDVLMAQKLSVGDIVLFPHAGGLSKGSVEEIYGIPGRIKVVINMTPELTGIDVMEPTTVVWPIERVQLVQSAA